MAGEASREPDVIAFREEILGGRLLALEEVPGWIKDRAAEDGGPTVWWRFPLPRGADGYDWREPFDEWLIRIAESLRRMGSAFTPAGWSIELIEFLVPESDWVHSLPIAHDGVLARLKHLATTLVRRCPVWREASAVTYLLTGRTPHIPPATVGMKMAWHFPALGRATLELDPSLTQKEVARLYDDARKMGDVTPRMPSRTDVELALTTGDLDLESAASGELAHRMTDWNASHPGMRYSSVEAFMAAADAARRTVLGWPEA